MVPCTGPHGPGLAWNAACLWCDGSGWRRKGPNDGAMKWGHGFWFGLALGILASAAVWVLSWRIPAMIEYYF